MVEFTIMLSATPPPGDSFGAKTAPDRPSPRAHIPPETRYRRARPRPDIQRQLDSGHHPDPPSCREERSFAFRQNAGICRSGSARVGQTP